MKFLGKIETVLIIIFGLLFLMWTASKCCSSKPSYQERKERVAQQKDSASIAPETILQPLPPKEEPLVESATTTMNPPPNTNQGARLFVQVDGLKVRTGPSLDSALVAKLNLHDQVFFLNEKTEFKQEIHMNNQDFYEPWVKVKTKSGKSGWVYGGGVHYYKRD